MELISTRKTVNANLCRWLPSPIISIDARRPRVLSDSHRAGHCDPGAWTNVGTITWQFQSTPGHVADKYDLASIANKTEGYSGAELEQIVVSAMIDAFGQERVLAQEDLEKSREQLVPLSVTMEEKVFQLREWAASRCRRATSDSRVTQMLEEEQRHAQFLEEVEAAKEQWMELAEHGQLNAAVIEYLRRCDVAPFPKLQEDFAPFLTTIGEQGLALRADPNVVLWSGMSQELATLLSSLIAQRRIYLHATGVDVYKALGKAVRLPVVEKLDETRQARPVWMPAAFRLLPPEGGSSRFARVARINLSLSGRIIHASGRACRASVNHGVSALARKSLEYSQRVQSTASRLRWHTLRLS
jgi:hypothetical protein